MSREVMHIGVDFDDVLVNSAQCAIAVYNNQYGSDLTLDDWYDFTDMSRWQADDLSQAAERVGAIFSSDEFADSVEALPGSQAALEDLQSRGHRLTIITGRLAVARAQTLRTAERLFPGLFSDQSLYLTSHFAADGQRRRKSYYSQQLGMSHYLDDQAIHVSDVAQTQQVHVALFGSYPWNQQEVAGIPRLAQWSQYQEFFNQS